MIQPPKNHIPSPFCAIGDKTILPESGGETEGFASYAAGFPPVTQKPPSAGGVAPQRMDFNGILFVLSAFTFWQQSGGQMAWSATLSYTQPCLVYHNNVLWWCLKNNGPNVPDGIKEPNKTNNAYWVGLLDALADMTADNGSAAGLFGNPVGTYVLYHGITAPDGYFACAGGSFSASKYPKLYARLGSTLLPDLRGQFARGYDSVGIVDPDGPARNIGSKQTDAGRNVTGSFNADVGNHNAIGRVSGAFTDAKGYGNGDTGSQADEVREFTLDASSVWGGNHTAAEFRPTNFCALWCIKHD